MAERYIRLFTSDKSLYTENSPLTIEAGALLKDNETGRIIAQLKFRNIQDKNIKLVKVAINSFDSLGRPLNESTEYQYLDLNETRDSEFGSKNAIILPDNATRSFSAKITEVGFADNSVWKAPDKAEWSALPTLKTIDAEHGTNALKQVRLTYGNSCQYIPAKKDGLWLCSCGAINAVGEDSCHKCGLSANALFSIDYEQMDADAKERLESERKDAIYQSAINSAKQHPIDKLNTEGLEKAIKQLKTITDWKDSKEKIEEYTKQIEEIKAQQEANRIAAAKCEKKKKIITAVTIPSIIAVIAFVILLFTVIIPNGKYNDAITLMDAGKYHEAITAFEAMDGYKDSDNMALESQYLQAIALMDAGKYSEAISAFEALDGYKDSDNMALESQYLQATDLMENGEYETARNMFLQLGQHYYKDSINMEKYSKALGRIKDGFYWDAINYFKELGDFRDSKAKIEAISDQKYNEAVKLMSQGKYTEAITAFEKLGDFKDSSQKAKNAQDLRLHNSIEQLRNAKVGDYVTFGAYEQDNNTENGKEDIEWLVLEIKDGKALVISKYALDCKPYNISYDSVTWENCTLRKWLNNDFINSAFSVAEKAMIPTVTVSADKNPEHSIDPGNATQDQVFLLSITEANKYFSSYSARQCQPTDYAVGNGAWTSHFGNCYWWLRSPGNLRSYATNVTSGGGIAMDGGYVFNDDYAVRPAMWINIE